MAGENQNTGPNTDPKSYVQGDLTKSQASLKNLREGANEVGNIREGLRETANLLKELERSYGKISDKLKSLKRDTINISKIEGERAKAVQDLEKSKRKLVEFETRNQSIVKDLNEQLKKESELREKVNLGVFKGKELFKKIKELKQFEADATYQQYKALLNANVATKERLGIVDDILEEEKRVAKEVGNTGFLLKNLGKILPGAKRYYSQIVEEAREGEKRTKLLVIAAAGLGAAMAFAYKTMKGFVNIASQGLNSLTGSGGPLSNFVSPFTNLIKQIPFLGGIIGGLIDAFANIVDFATGANSETQKFARNLGISYGYAKALTDQFDAFARNSGQAFITVEKLRKSQTELSAALGINNVFSQEILAADSQLNEQLGLELETRKQLAAVTGITGQLQTKIFANLAAQTKLLAANLGVNIRVQDSIRKAASFGGVLGLTFAKYPEKLTKSLLITKALGMDLEKLNGLASGLLDFESSIANEFEAQLLTGKNINLMKARELALNNDLEGLAVEINKQLGNSEEFLNMNRIQQESISQAVGMSRDEIADMLKQQELFAAAGAKTQKQFKENIILMQQRGTLQSDFLSKLSEEQAQLFLNSTATETIAAFLDKIKQSFANLLNNPGFKNLIDNVLKNLQDPAFIDSIINKISTVVSLLLKAVAVLPDIADAIPGIDTGNLGGKIRSIANQIQGVSLTGSVLKNQAGYGVSNQTSTTGNASPINLNVDVHTKSYTTDHPKDMEKRVSMAVLPDQRTGQLGK